MKHFCRLVQGIPVNTLIASLMRHQELWNALSSPQQIILRNGVEFRDTEAGKLFPDIKRVVLDTMATFGASLLGPVSVQRIEPGTKVAFKAEPKEDQFSHYRLVLYSRPGAVWFCGDESADMQERELWWIDSKLANAINNASDDHVVHVLMQMRHDA